MNEIVVKLGELEMVHLIMDLLSLSDKGCWTRTTVNDRIIIEFKGDIRKVQKEIYKWLSIPERKSNF